MRSVTLLEFRKNAKQVLRRTRNGERQILTFRGVPIARLDPVDEQAPSGDDPIYHLCDKADGRKRGSLTNEQMDSIVYGR